MIPKTIVHMESSNDGFSLDTSGSVVIMGQMLGRTIADIEAKLPEPIAELFRIAITKGYRNGGEEGAENETVTGDSQSE